MTIPTIEEILITAAKAIAERYGNLEDGNGETDDTEDSQNTADDGVISLPIYYKDKNGFDLVIDLKEDTGDKLLLDIRNYPGIEDIKLIKATLYIFAGTAGGSDTFHPLTLVSESVNDQSLRISCFGVKGRLIFDLPYNFSYGKRDFDHENNPKDYLIVQRHDSMGLALRTGKIHFASDHYNRTEPWRG